MTRKPTGQWIARKRKGWPLRKGKLVVDGKVIAHGITHDQATNQFPEYKILADGRKRDPLDHLPGSYGSRQ